MTRSSISPLTKIFLTFVACLALVAANASAQDDDPPAEAGRLSIVNGNVSIQPAGSQDWGQASLNYPLGPGDRIFTDADGRAEIQVGRTYVRIGPNSDITFVDFNSQAVTFGAAQGAMHVRSRGLWEGQSLYVQTPSGTSTVTGPSDFRVDVYPDQQTAIFTNLEGNLYISGANDFGMDEQPGQALELVGTNPVYPQWLQPNAPDDLDNWSQRRDAQMARAASYQYVSPETSGAEDLDAYGQWQPGTEYGDMWFPTVQPGWSPYHNGHWVNREPWGWVWVEDEPWGYAPFHYGRWVNYHDRWGWIPGPREDHPVWSPALVAFAGGGAGGGGGISIWFPLGPGEAYRPWYRCSPRYVDRVNISNIRETRVVHVQKTYVNVTNVTSVTNITYVNRTVGSTAVRQQDFAAGRSVQQTAVRVDPRQLAQAQVIAKPQVVPTHEAVINRPVAKPVPVAVARPMLINAKGMSVAAQPKARPVPPPVKTTPPPPSIPNRVAIAPPQNVKMTQAARQAMQSAPHPVQQPARPGQPPAQQPAPAPTAGRPAAPPAPGQQPAPIPGNQPRPAPIPTPGTHPPAQPVPQQPCRPGQPNQPVPQQPARPGQPNQTVPPPHNENQPAPPPQPGRPTYQPPNQPNQPGAPPHNENRPAPPPQPVQPNRPTYQQPAPPQRPQDRPAPYQPPASAPPHSSERPAPPPQQTPPRQVERPAPYQQPAPQPRPAERPAPPPQAQPRNEAPPRQAAPPRQNAEPAPRQQPPPERNPRPADKDKDKPHN
jgi:hypothetical protein